MPHYFILPNPVASPAKCGLCGYGGSDRNYLDPRLDFEFYGSLIFCENCVGTMANDFDFLSPAQARVLDDRVTEAERELVTLRAAVIHLENAHDALNSVRSLFDDNVPAGLSDDSASESQSVPTLAVGAESISSVLERSGDSEIDESSGEQGPNDIPDPVAEFERLLNAEL